MSDQTPPTDASPAEGRPPAPPAPEAAPPVTPPVPPSAAPAPPYTAPGYTASGYTASGYTAPGYTAPPMPPQHVPPQQLPPYAVSPYPPSSPGLPPTSYPGASPSTSAAPEKKPGGLGLVALLLALAAAVIAPVAGAVAAFQVGVGTGTQLQVADPTAWEDLSFLSPVREWVLLGEIAFWAGTVLGIWAIVQGIVAIVKRRGLGTGIAAVVVGGLGVFVFGTVVYAAAVAGLATGAGTGV